MKESHRKESASLDLFSFCEQLSAAEWNDVMSISRKNIRGQMKDTPDDMSRCFGLLVFDLLENASAAERVKARHKTIFEEIEQFAKTGQLGASLAGPARLLETDWRPTSQESPSYLDENIVAVDAAGGIDALFHILGGEESDSPGGTLNKFLFDQEKCANDEFISPTLGTRCATEKDTSTSFAHFACNMKELRDICASTSIEERRSKSFMKRTPDYKYDSGTGVESGSASDYKEIIHQLNEMHHREMNMKCEINGLRGLIVRWKNDLRSLYRSSESKRQPLGEMRARWIVLAGNWAEAQHSIELSAVLIDQLQHECDVLECSLRDKVRTQHELLGVSSKKRCNSIAKISQLNISVDENAKSIYGLQQSIKQRKDDFESRWEHVRTVMTKSVMSWYHFFVDLKELIGELDIPVLHQSLNYSCDKNVHFSCTECQNSIAAVIYRREISELTEAWHADIKIKELSHHILIPRNVDMKKYSRMINRTKDLTISLLNSNFQASYLEHDIQFANLEIDHLFLEGARSIRGKLIRLEEIFRDRERLRGKLEAFISSGFKRLAYIISDTIISRILSLKAAFELELLEMKDAKRFVKQKSQPRRKPRRRKELNSSLPLLRTEMNDETSSFVLSSSDDNIPEVSARIANDNVSTHEHSCDVP